MSKVARARQNWRCPSCGRKYRIPAKAEAPAVCPECAEEKKALAARESTVIKKELSLSQTTSSEPAVTTTFFTPADADEQPATEAKPRRTSIVEPIATADSFVTRAEVDEVLQQLKNISKTMTMIRRTLRLFVVMVFLSVASTGYFLWKTWTDTTNATELPQALQELLNGKL